MGRAKYVVGEVSNSGLPVLVAIVFPTCIPHEAVKHVFLLDTITSAGFFEINTSGEVVTYGESKGLGVCVCRDQR